MNKAIFVQPYRFAAVLLRLTLTLAVGCYFLALIGYIAARLLIGDRFWLLGWVNNFATYYFLPCLITLPILLLLRSKRLVVVNILLLGLFLGWSAPRLLPDVHLTPAAMAQSAAEPLKVVSFNVWGANSHLDEVTAWLASTDADLILLQEIPPVWAGVGVEALRQGYPYQFSQRTNVRYWGNAVLSRYPILDVQPLDLAEGFGGHFRLLIDLNGTRVAVYDIHLVEPQRTRPRLTLPRRLQNGLLDMVLKYDDGWRNRQIDTLLGVLEAEPYPFIAAGDFNLSADSVKYGDLAHRLRDSFDSAGIGIGATWPVAAVAGLPRIVPPIVRIDYIWNDGSFDVLHAAVGQPLGSDHLPVLATLALRDSS